MVFLLMSSLLFGLANPLGALLVESEDALVFSFQFLAILTIVQLPFVIRNWREVIRFTFRKEFSLLLMSGFIGTFLYWCEFSSLQVGLPISHITFLALTVPAWTLLYEWARGRGTKWNINKWVLALIGSAILIAPNARGQFSVGYLLPIFTSLLTAAWLIYSKKSMEAGISPLVCSFFNDLFSLVGVFAFIVMNRRMGSISIPENIGNIFLYSTLIGVLPNVLLFWGLKNTSVVSASTIIMLEPVMAGVLAVLINNDTLGVNFVLGSFCIMMSNLPDNFVFYIRKLSAARV